MSVFKLKTLPGNRWPALSVGELTRVWAAYQELDKTQWNSPQQILDGQMQQVRELLNHCIAHVPYYRLSLSAAGVSPRDVRSMEDFRNIPLLPRRTYQQQLNSFLAEKLPPGTVATGDRATSGSSGTPTRVYQTNFVNLWWLAFYMRDIEWCGMDPMGAIAAIRSSGKKGDELRPFLQGVVSPAWLKSLEPLIHSGRAYMMDISQDHRRQMQWLRQIEPDYLLSYPANLEVLAAMVGREGSIPSLKIVHAISDTLNPQVRETIESAFGVPLRNTYSCMEAGYLASPCPDGHGMHVHGENVILEVLDDAGRPCGAGQTGHVFVTTLHNFRAPFIRYELGDRVTLGDEKCPCGRGLPLLASVQGKESPMFHLPGGRRKSTTRLAFMVRKVGGHFQHQVAQLAEDHVVVRIVRDATWTDEHAVQIQEKVCEFFESPIRVEIEFHDRLPVPPSGKFQNMVIEMSPQSAPMPA